MTHPADKTIGNITIGVDLRGWPRWTRIRDQDGKWINTLNEEQARDLHYALTRIVAFLEDARECDRLSGIIA